MHNSKCFIELSKFQHSKVVFLKFRPTRKARWCLSGNHSSLKVNTTHHRKCHLTEKHSAQPNNISLLRLGKSYPCGEQLPKVVIWFNMPSYTTMKWVYQRTWYGINQWRSVGDLTTHAIFGLRLDDVIVLS